MKQSLEAFRKECKEIEKAIWKEYVETSGKNEAIPDGVINIDAYYQEELRILWILKEPYDFAGGGWSFPQVLKNKKTSAEFAKSKTIQRVIYASYGILNGFVPWEDIDDVAKNPELVRVLERVAYMNINKLPGKTTTTTDALTNAYEQHRTLLLRQIKSYEPNVVIGGSTLGLFKDDLQLGKLKKASMANTASYASKAAVFLDAYHPAQRSIKPQIYVDEIITTVKKWRNK